MGAPRGSVEFAEMDEPERLRREHVAGLMDERRSARRGLTSPTVSNALR